MPKSDINAEVYRIREILGKIRDPYDRYQLTLLLETAARVFESTDAADGLITRGKGKRKCKRNRHILPH